MEFATKLRRMLVPVDFSDCSRAALTHARMLQELSRAHIHIVHTYELPPFLPAYAVLPVGELNASAVEHGRRFTTQRLAEFLSKLSIKPGDTLCTSVEEGPAAEAIVALATREKCDLIVMGTLGRGLWSRALVGSTTDKVLRSAPCAVLTVKALASRGAAGN